jgi:hypothetical protein
MAMSFVSTRAATLSLLLGSPLVHAFACSSPARNFDEGGTSGAVNGGGAGRGGAASSGGTASHEGGKGTVGMAGEGAGTEGDTTGSGGDTTGSGDAGAGGEISPAGGTGSGGTTGDGGTLGTSGTTNTGGRASTGGDEGTGGRPNTGGASSTGGANTGGSVSTGGAKATGGAPTGGSVSTGGVNTGGSVSTGGAKATGGAPTGGSPTGGAPTGGSVSTGGGGGTCVPTGSEVCTDALDNDCNGHVDCLNITGTFPDFNGAAAGKDVQIIVSDPVILGSKFQCRSARGPAVPDQVTWVDCPTGANTRIMPRTLTESKDPANDGLWTTQVRAIFPNKATTDPLSFTYYMHSSLHDAARCTPKASDAAYFAAAPATVLSAGAFGTTQTVLRAPFIQLGFQPTVSNYFKVNAGEGITKLMSLRRRFVRRADDKYVLMTRNYASSRSGVCDAIELRTHSNELPLPTNHNRYFYDICDAVVFNKLGAGVCLYVDGTGKVQKRTTHKNPYTTGAGYSPDADNFVWRHLLDKQAASDGYLHFMPKCTTALCNKDNHSIFLPDRGQFPYF